MEKAGELQYKSDEEDDDSNPYDSEEENYAAAARADIQHQAELKEGEKKEAEGESGEEDGDSYDSELEADFFGKKDPELNA